MQLREILTVAVVGALVSACGSATTTDPMMNVYLVDAPSPGYQQVNVDVQKVEIAGDSGWVTLGTPNQVFDLLGLSGGVVATLVKGATLPPGHYGQMRLVLGSRNTVKLADGNVEPLTIPSGMQSGVKLTVSFDVEAGKTRDVYIDFDAHNSIFIHEAGASGKYMLRPTVRAFDGAATGSISGTLTVSGTTGPIAGATVTAQTVASGQPAVARTTITNDSGHYVLDLLPTGTTYYVVSQPAFLDTLGAVVATYEPQASGPIAISAASPVGGWNAAFVPAIAWGTVMGAVNPVATIAQADTVDVRHSIGGQPFILRTVPAVVSGTESYTVPGLPTAAGGRDYSIIGTRRTTDSSGNDTFTTRPAVPATVTVTQGGTVTADITFVP
jgi:hypothetical protein